MKDYGRIVAAQQAFFNTGRTLSIPFRLHQLKTLRAALKNDEARVTEALHADLGKSPYEAYMTEIGIVLEEIRFYLRKTPKWAKPHRVRTPYYHFPATSRVYPEPFGTALIIGPWNYPFQLIMAPLVAAMAAGNCAVLKPSEFSVHTSDVLKDLISRHFDPAYITVELGDAETSKGLLEQKFDKIFFTGSPAVGRKVMAAAAKNLVPVTLELGGKNPCIVEKDADLHVTAKRIVSGKYINAGQTCIAPDYLLVHRSIRDRMIDEIRNCIDDFFGKDPSRHPAYPRIIHKDHLRRLVALTEGTEVIFGGVHHAQSLYFAPTLLKEPDLSHPVMEEEIFGPILPVVSYDSISEVIELVKSRPRPLALYLFTSDRSFAKTIMKRISFGGGCINDTLIHFATPYLPFGGVGGSGVGSYHGKFGFDAFSHQKGVMKNGFLIDLPFRYPRFFRHINILKKVLR
jgi:aldehyde dehydrogenase (NAD+)